MLKFIKEDWVLGDMERFTNRLIVITGGGSDPESDAVGFGFQIASDLYKRGTKVVILGTRIHRLEDAMQRIVSSDSDRFGFYECDVSDAARVAEVFSHIKDNYGNVYGLVNNAAINVRKNSLELSIEDWDRIIGVNLSGAFYCRQTAMRQMKDQGVGSVVDISSIGVKFPFGGMSSYGASKGGLETLAMYDAKDLDQFGIRINVVRPGYGRTPLTAKYLDGLQVNDRSRYDEIVARQPDGGLVTPKQVSKAVLDLLDPSCTKTGQIVEVANGYRS